MMNPCPLGSGLLAGKSYSLPHGQILMPSPFFRNHFHPQLVHLDHTPALCYDTFSGKQRCVALAPNDLPWAMQDVMTSWTLPNTHQLTQVQQSTSVCQMRDW